MSSSVASSLPLVWCSARETMDIFGRYGDMVASAKTMAADISAVKIASNLQPHAAHPPCCQNTPPKAHCQPERYSVR